MKLLEKIEDLIFDSQVMSRIEIIKDRWVIVKAKCVIEYLADDMCLLRTPTGIQYKILGASLQVKEYGDLYVKVVGETINGFLIEGDRRD